MKLKVAILGACIVLAVGANTALGQWFADQFDSYGTCTCIPCSCSADQNAFRALWLRDPAFYSNGSVTKDYNNTCPSGFRGWSPPFSWKEPKQAPIRNWRSLVPEIQTASADPTKNAVNGSQANPLFVQFYFWLGEGKGMFTSLWLELVGQDIAGKCDTTAGTCALSDGTCTIAAPDTCVANVCTNNCAACNEDADCNACTGGVHAGFFCTTDTDCHDRHTCSNNGVACTSDGDCGATNLCVGGFNNGNSCSTTTECSQGSTFSAPVKNPGTPAGVCGVGDVCTAGFPALNGDDCVSDADCDAPMRFTYTGTPPSSCIVQNSTPSLPKPSLAFGYYGGGNGLIPKDDCDVSRQLNHPVLFDGNKWWQLKSGAPPGAAGGDVAVPSKNLASVTLTIRDTTMDINTVQEGPGTCALNDGTCNTSAGTCPNNDGYCDLEGTHLCIGGVHNGIGCTSDLDCRDTHLCTNNGRDCDVNSDCNVCVGGVNADSVCATDLDCQDTHLCVNGQHNNDPCTSTSQCRTETYSKTNITRQYTGPFQAIAIGPGRIYDGSSKDSNDDAYKGSEYFAHFDDIAISGGEFLTVATGACCLTDGTCLENTMEAACLKLGGTYAEDNVDCASAGCAVGVCCLPNGDCRDDLDEAGCGGLSGVFKGLGTHCDDPDILCCPIPFADADHDGDVDQMDFAAFQLCYLVTPIPDICKCWDRPIPNPPNPPTPKDGVVDINDFTEFDKCWTGPNVPFDRENPGACTP